jgi:hypothetical protein
MQADRLQARLRVERPNEAEVQRQVRLAKRVWTGRRLGDCIEYKQSHPTS